MLAPVAQLDRASDYGSEGRGFESLSAHTKQKDKVMPLNKFRLLMGGYDTVVQWEQYVDKKYWVNFRTSNRYISNEVCEYDEQTRHYPWTEFGCLNWQII